MKLIKVNVFNTARKIVYINPNHIVAIVPTLEGAMLQMAEKVWYHISEDECSRLVGIIASED